MHHMTGRIHENASELIEMHELAFQGNELKRLFKWELKINMHFAIVVAFSHEKHLNCLNEHRVVLVNCLILIN